ncbi:Cof-type HAD-IIB family hydrolase [Jeotgalibacillus soli]|uniref:Phosphatase n=1 Tax=Jeotgalibacillus soli TaxID=889306 RepID=A0A0C2VJR3_9BACL|nr:Cof-type HAD-IIB family hydrolase [Jeotgalibacillus soli]KIL44721.1 hypothetical protein KP78_22650 [Jeotgalibacillus soli]
MKRIVFFDIDGTLLDSNKLLPESTKTAINSLKESGAYVAIATGRAPFMFKELREELGISTFVSFNGQYVVLEGEVIKENKLSAEKLKELVMTGDRQGHPFIHMSSEEMKANAKQHPLILESFASLHFEHPPYDPNYYKHHKILQSLLFCEEKDEDQYVKQFPEFDFVRWHRYSTDVLPRGGSKANGIREIVNQLGFSMEEVVAFGDGPNDKEMLTEVGTGVVMGNASDEIKKCGAFVTAHVDENGVEKGLKRLGWI